MQGYSLLDELKMAWKKPDNALVQIIIINLSVFILLNVLRVILSISGNPDTFEHVLYQIALPSDITSFLYKPWTLITYFFTHEGFFHILFNMLFFYWFGRIIYEFLGNNKLINLYILGGLAGGLMFILIYNLVPYFHNRVQTSILLGASAGVLAVVVGAATYMPNYTVFLLFLGPVKIKYIAIFYVLLSFFRIDGTNAGGELAHLGGAIIGYFYIIQLKKGNDFGQPIIKLLVFIKSLFKPRPRVKVSYKSNTKNSSKDKTSKEKKSGVSQDEIDAILDKISKGGYESLTKQEKQKLFDASKK
jgi:membrane associated rhomboid family serine protease